MRSMSVRRIFAVVAMLCVGVVVVGAQPLLYAYEDVVIAFDGTAKRGIRYGDRHFNATSPWLYDIDRAEDLYMRAEAFDAGHPALQHQLARVAFLKGDFSEARERIDKEIAMYGEKNPNAYYIRALILGYQEKYLLAAADYEEYFKLAPANWAGINDYSWVLLKADLPEGALAALEWGLSEWPENPWLLHNKVIALYELGRYEEAAVVALAATTAVETVTEADWLNAYPGNDPRSAPEGLASFKAAVAANTKKVGETLEASHR